MASWREVALNRRFAAFTLCGSAYFALYNQLYLALPLEARRVTGAEWSVSAVFLVSTLVGIAVQLPLTRWCAARWQPGTCLAAGLALMGVGFVPLMLSAVLLHDAVEVAWLPAVPVLAGTVVFTVGIALANPFTMQLLPVVGSTRLMGTYYGYFYLVSAILAAVASAMVGGLLDLPAFPAGPGALLLLLGLAGAAGMAVLQRQGALKI